MASELFFSRVALVGAVVIFASSAHAWQDGGNTEGKQPPKAAAPGGDAPAPAAKREPSRRQRPAWTPPGKPALDRESLDKAVSEGVKFLLSKQEPALDGRPNDAWPYEGVYRVRDESGKAIIPIGYRVGGTSIACCALLEAPGASDDADRKAALERAAKFVIDSIEHPLMNPDYDGGYDVRGWGYTYALMFLLRYEDANLVPDALKEGVEKAIAFYIKAIEETAIPQVGGWNYARAVGKEKVSNPSPFMTAPTLDALFEAAAHGRKVDAKVVEQALDTLAKSKMSTGSIVYAGFANARSGDGTPGAIGRMLAANTTLYLAGKATQADVRGSLDAFLVHWPWLEQRRKKSGTHEGPYAIAPYYFYYAHRAAARAIECLPENERAEYRRKFHEVLFTTRDEDGTWNDRVFPRSASFGTACAMLSIMQPSMKAPTRWEAKDAKEQAIP